MNMLRALGVTGAAVRNLALGLGPVRRWASRYHVTGVEGQADRARTTFAFYTARVSPEGKRLLEIGPGRMLETLALARTAGAVKCMALDILRYRTDEQARALGVDYRVYDGVRIPCPDRSVDLVWASYVLQHLRYPERSMRELYRALSPGGHLVCRVDLRDHYLMHERGRQYECLSYSPLLWKCIAWNRGSYVNRLRFSEWQHLLAAEGFERVGLERSEDPELLRQNREHAYLRHFSDEDLLVYRFDAVYRKLPAGGGE